MSTVNSEMNNQQQQQNQILFQWKPIVGVSVLIIFAAIIIGWGEDCTVEVRGIPDVLAVMVKEKKTLTLHRINKKGKTCSDSRSVMDYLYESTDKLTCSLVPDSAGDAKREDCTLKEAGFGQIEVSIQPNSRGWHKMNTEQDGEHINGSPFKVFVLKTFGVPMFPIHTIDKLQAPQGITFNQTGHLVVVEYTAHRVCFQ